MADTLIARRAAARRLTVLTFAVSPVVGSRTLGAEAVLVEAEGGWREDKEGEVQVVEIVVGVVRALLEVSVWRVGVEAGGVFNAPPEVRRGDVDKGAGFSGGERIIAADVVVAALEGKIVDVVTTIHLGKHISIFNNRMRKESPRRTPTCLGHLRVGESIRLCQSPMALCQQSTYQFGRLYAIPSLTRMLEFVENKGWDSWKPCTWRTCYCRIQIILDHRARTWNIHSHGQTGEQQELKQYF
jgi:hypothetical protein